MLLWQALRAEYSHLNWMFGDYGVRGPGAAEGTISPHTNGKIRHTINKHFFVVRGHSVQLGEKGGQMHKLSETLVSSGHFLGPTFSWGDSQILACSQKKIKPGNSTSWIAIDNNHHIAYVVAEIEEFVRSTVITEPSEVE